MDHVKPCSVALNNDGSCEACVPVAIVRHMHFIDKRKTRIKSGGSERNCERRTSERPRNDKVSTYAVHGKVSTPTYFFPFSSPPPESIVTETFWPSDCVGPIKTEVEIGCRVPENNKDDSNL